MSEMIEVGDIEFELSHPEKVLFPGDGITKRDLVDYYIRVAETARPYWQDRAVSMQRFPDGIDEEGFFQKDAPDYFPDWIRRAELSKKGGKVSHVVADYPATLAYLAGQGCITPHLSLSRVDRPDHPDRMIFDLDPSGEDFSLVRDAAGAVRDLAGRLGASAFVQTTGSKGFHVLIPLDRSAEFDTARDVAHRMAEFLAGEAPDTLTVEQRKNKRGGRVFLDYLRNAYGQTGIAPYGVRPLGGAPVATPLDWNEALGDVFAQDYTLANIFRRLGQKRDPWQGIDDAAVSANDLAARLENL